MGLWTALHDITRRFLMCVGASCARDPYFNLQQWRRWVYKLSEPGFTELRDLQDCILSDTKNVACNNGAGGYWSKTVKYLTPSFSRKV